jgi:hypothetical protein
LIARIFGSFALVHGNALLLKHAKPWESGDVITTNFPSMNGVPIAFAHLRMA